MAVTPAVAFQDESFWVAIAAAAPVIALAAIVSLSDTSGAMDKLREIWPRFLERTSHNKEADDWLFKRIGQGDRLTAWANFSAIGMGLQVAMLAIALVALVNRSNVVPPIVPEIAVPLGVFLLLVSALNTATMRRLPKYTDDYLRTNYDLLWRRARGRCPVVWARAASPYVPRSFRSRPPVLRGPLSAAHGRAGSGRRQIRAPTTELATSVRLEVTRAASPA
jgi:hypothetical protein